MSHSDDSQTVRMNEPKSRRHIIGIFLAMDLGFKFPSLFAFSLLIGVDALAAHCFVLKLFTSLAAPVTVLSNVLLFWLLHPIEKWRRAAADGTATDALVKRACQVVYTAPSKFSLIFMGQNLLLYSLLVPLLRYVWPGRVAMDPHALAGSLFVLTGMVCCPLSLSFVLLGWLLRPGAARLSLSARDRKVQFQARGVSLFQALIGMALCLSLGPTTAMAGIAYISALQPAASAQHASMLLLAILGFLLMTLVWAVQCAALLARNITQPVVSIATTLSGIARAGEVQKTVGIPVTSWDEVGDLVMGVNDMIDKLADAALQKAALQKLEASYAAAREATRAKSEFVTNMSHEIRTPMTAIIGYTDLLLDPDTTPSDRLTHVQTIRRNGEHLLGLLNDLLDLSMIESGHIAVANVACSPSHLIADVVSLMRVRAKEKKIDLQVEYKTPIPETIHSDPTRIRQILMNLVGNAIKFTEHGRVRILARCDMADHAKPRLSFEIADTGIGLSKEQIGKIFQPFIQADTSLTRKFGGSGLGLSISQRLTTMLGGELKVESLAGQGSSFTLTLDTGPLDGVKMLTGMTEAGPTDAHEAASVSWSNIRLSCSVLLAEDGPDNQRLIPTLLRKAGATVEIAENGRIAVEMVFAAGTAGTPYDVILMDMQMPELDGYGATTKLRQHDYKGAIVALTAHSMAGDRGKCLAAGCTDYLTKPIDRAKLLATVAKYAEQAKQKREKPVVRLAPPVQGALEPVGATVPGQTKESI